MKYSENSNLESFEIENDKNWLTKPQSDTISNQIVVQKIIGQQLVIAPSSKRFINVVNGLLAFFCVYQKGVISQLRKRENFSVD